MRALVGAKGLVVLRPSPSDSRFAVPISCRAAASVEPCGQSSQVIGNQQKYGEKDVADSQMDSQKLDANSPDLARIIDYWQNLPENVKQAINVLVTHYCEVDRKFNCSVISSVSVSGSILFT